MKLHAYVLAGDPAWIAQSIRSYYGIVDRIVVSYDRSGLSWSGAPLSVDESRRRLEVADPDGKMVLLPGDYADPSRAAMAGETAQRQDALDAASDGADWVLQLDTDEIAPAPNAIARSVATARSRGATALDFPLRTIYARTRSGSFLESCGRLWTDRAAYPGAIAVASGTRLSFARQTGTAPLHRVDVAPWNTDPAHGATTPVHEVVPLSSAILHMSWVRTEAQLAEKQVVSGHAGESSWEQRMALWRRRSDHPRATTMRTPFSGDPSRWFRIVRLAAYADVQP